MKVNCCKSGSTMLEYLEKREIFILHPEKEKWWVVVDYCPFCGVKLQNTLQDITEEMESF